MKKFGCLILAVFCLGGLCQVCRVGAISQEQESVIVDHCDQIRESLKKVQKNDARTRVFLGSHFETILSKFITPLNVRLVENNLSDADLIQNQGNFTTARSTFVIDFISYQQDLEELVLIDCRVEPSRFYDKLLIVRERRKIMVQDVERIKEIILNNVRLVEGLRSKL